MSGRFGKMDRQQKRGGRKLIMSIERGIIEEDR